MVNMRIGGFELPEPLPRLRQPHVIASLTPWIDAGGAGTLALTRLEQLLGAQDLGGLVSPGSYFDFTRYRPTLRFKDGQRQTLTPNVDVRYAKGQHESDFIFLHLLEPHTRAEEYLDSVVALMQHFLVKRYCRIGSTYGGVPHTRPLPVMATNNGEPVTSMPGVNTMLPDRYEGPVSIVNLIGEKASALGIDNMTLVVRLPQYIRLDEDYNGAARLLNVLCSMYDLPEEISMGQDSQEQYQQVSDEIGHNPELGSLVKQLEADYDARLEHATEGQPPQLSPSIEEFLEGL
jgi:hypothetical protein